jgi:retron-type reverse transcriptase
MKTYKHLYPQITSFENLYLAYLAAKKGKSGKAPVAAFMRKREDEMFALQNELQNKTYQPGAYHSFYVHDPKKRLISAAPFRDRVVHHALYNVIEPIFERRFIEDSYANRVGKGTHRALDRSTQFARRYPYVLQCDVRQFFPSIDHAILYKILARYIVDQDTLWLIERILQSGQGVLSEEYEMVWFQGDDLLAVNRPRGLPIGNLTSQFWANVYLNELDQFVKRELKCKAYIRYVDDFLLFGEDKKILHGWRDEIISKLAELRLTLHEGQAQVYPVNTGIPFLGFRVYPEYRRLKARRSLHFRRKLKNLVTQTQNDWSMFPKFSASIQGWVNHARFGDTWQLRKSVLGGIHL